MKMTAGMLNSQKDPFEKLDFAEFMEHKKRWDYPQRVPEPQWHSMCAHSPIATHSVIGGWDGQECQIEHKTNTDN